MTDRLIDDLADSIAGKVKAKHPEVYDQNEKMAYEKYVATARAAGEKPLSYDVIKRANDVLNKLKKKAGAKG